MAEEVITNEPKAEYDPFRTRPVSNASAPVIIEAQEEEESETPVVAENKKEVVATAPEVKEIIKTEPIIFANPESEKYFTYLKEGKEDDLYNLLHEKRTLASVDKMTDEAKIKLDLKYNNPDLDDNDINGLFEETYERPEKPTLVDDPTTEEQDAYDKELAKWEKKNKTIDNKIARASKQATKSLSARTSELKLPDIEKPVLQPTPEELAKAKKEQEDFLASVDSGVNSFKGYSTVFKDEEVEIPVSYALSEEEKAEYKKKLPSLDVNQFFGARWFNEDGSFNGEQMFNDIYLIENKDKIIQKAANEAGSKRLEEYRKSKKNINLGNGSNGRIVTQVNYSPEQHLDRLRQGAFKERSN